MAEPALSGQRAVETSFGRYRFIALLGHGGMADVFLAVLSGPSGFSKLAVVKRVREHLAGEEEFSQMLLDEARISARLNHPNVVQVNEVGEVDGKIFLAMEYLDGQPLSRVQRLAPSDDRWQSLYIYLLSEVCSGLHYAHELLDYDGAPLSIVHRDVTPQNVFVTYEGQVKVLDFGIARASGRSVETQQGVIKGKVRYMAPEQAMGLLVDRRSDVFAVGIMLWEAITGQRLWGARDEIDILRGLFEGAPLPMPSSVASNVPPELERICMKALCISADDRYPTALAMRKDLEAYLASSGKLADARASLGTSIAELFADRRREISAVIEKQITTLRAEGQASIPAIDPSSPYLETPSPTSAVNLSVVQPTLIQAPVAEPASEVSEVASVQRTSTSSRRWPILAGAALVAGIAGASFFATRTSPRETTSPSAPTVAPTVAPTQQATTSAEGVVATATTTAPAPSAGATASAGHVNTASARAALPRASGTAARTASATAPSTTPPSIAPTAAAAASTAAPASNPGSGRLGRPSRPLASGDPWESP